MFVIIHVKEVCIKDNLERKILKAGKLIEKFLNNLAINLGDIRLK